VVVGLGVFEDTYEEATPTKVDEPLNKAIELLKAKNG
jgi:hypothetical protein